MASTKQTKLDAIMQQIMDDNVTPELAAQAKQLVFGDGNPDANIVLIGEAPGKSEDEQGKPFVGASGKFLSEMLESIGLKREDVYITNIVKYHPPNNRDPLPEEKKVFLPYLQAQLEVIQPKIVVTLGRHSMNCFLPDLQISKVHGEPKRIRVQHLGRLGRPDEDAVLGAGEQRTEPSIRDGKGAAEPATTQRASRDIRVDGSAGKQDVSVWVILPLYHPAAALYNGSMRQTLIDDFAKIPNILKLI